MALENGKYEDMSSATVMQDCNDFSQGNLLQFDASGNMRVLRMDFYNKDVIGEPIVSSYPTSDKGHLTKYNHTTLSLANAAPSLSTLTLMLQMESPRLSGPLARMTSSCIITCSPSRRVALS